MGLHLNTAELQWVADYRRAIAEQYPHAVLHMLLYGAEAQSILFDDNNLNLLLVTRDEDKELDHPLLMLGLSLSDPADTDPFITVWTQQEWSRRGKIGCPFQKAMQQDGVWLQ